MQALALGVVAALACNPMFNVGEMESSGTCHLSFLRSGAGALETEFHEQMT